MRLTSSVGYKLLLLLLLLPIQRSMAADPFLFGVHPFASAEILKQSFSPIINYLERELDHPVELRIATDYSQHIENVGKNRVDFAYVGPVPYLKVVERYGEKPILAQVLKNGKPTFQGAIVISDRSLIRELGDLRSKRFLFGDPQSTMSYWVPRVMLEKNGVSLRQLHQFSHTNNHDNVALNVLSGYFDAGAVKLSIAEKYAPRGLKILAHTPPIPNHLIVASSVLSEPTRKEVSRHLMQLNKSDEGLNILKKMNSAVTGLREANDADFDQLRETLHSLD